MNPRTIDGIPRGRLGRAPACADTAAAIERRGATRHGCPRAPPLTFQRSWRNRHASDRLRCFRGRDSLRAATSRLPKKQSHGQLGTPFDARTLVYYSVCAQILP